MKKSTTRFLWILSIIVPVLILVRVIPHTSLNPYYHPPLDISPQLAADFGELREDHFHMGVDIRTRGKEGLPVYAVAEGFISHIRIEEYGLGNALFVTHPDGRTSVYGHLSRFDP